MDCVQSSRILVRTLRLEAMAIRLPSGAKTAESSPAASAVKVIRLQVPLSKSNSHGSDLRVDASKRLTMMLRPSGDTWGALYEPASRISLGRSEIGRAHV